jgi:hypothetical protein
VFGKALCPLVVGALTLTMSLSALTRSGHLRACSGPLLAAIVAAARSVDHRRVIDSATSDPGTVEESWAVRAQPSHTMSLNVTYRKGAAARQKSEGNVYSSVNTSVYRIYRWDLLADVAKSGPAGVDRVTSYSFDASIPEYANLFRNGQLVAVISQPMYVRSVWLP